MEVTAGDAPAVREWSRPGDPAAGIAQTGGIRSVVCCVDTQLRGEGAAGTRLPQTARCARRRVIGRGFVDGVIVGQRKASGIANSMCASSMKRARLFASLPADAGTRSAHPSLRSGLQHLRAAALRLAQEVIVNSREMLTAFCAR